MVGCPLELFQQTQSVCMFVCFCVYACISLPVSCENVAQLCYVSKHFGMHKPGLFLKCSINKSDHDN